MKSGATSVTSKGQVTIPVEVREQLGIPVATVAREMRVSLSLLTDLLGIQLPAAPRVVPFARRA